jgi:hypothetical protein
MRDHQQTDTIEKPKFTSPPGLSNSSTLRDEEAAAHFDHVEDWEVPSILDLPPAITEDQGDLDGDYHQPLEPDPLGAAIVQPLTDDLSYIWPSPTALGIHDDSIFLPGSAYLDAHSMLRSHLIHEVNADYSTRLSSPEVVQDGEVDIPVSLGNDAEGSATRHAALIEEEEFILLENWIHEISPWLDKFDSQRHFQHTIPIMARSHAHLRYSMLAASARQLERKERSTHTERSLALYQKAINLVLPELHTRSTPVIASCVVLCVLEMQSSSPKAWRQHLDGCAHLIHASGIHGFSGGVDQALFWCFARMDVCGGLITSMNTLIPLEHWAPGMTLSDQIGLFKKTDGFDAHACYAVYLCGHVLGLLAHRAQLASRVGASPASDIDKTSTGYVTRWNQLWSCIDDWYRYRPDEMLPVMTVNSSSDPFPKILYSNPAAISGNQLYHTASILMLQHKPPNITITPKPQSIFKHARQVCAISISNGHHGAWTNAIQPLWIAGQWMSHPSEQKAILRLLDRIESETGWGTKWRAEDLKEFWGE